MLRVLLAEDSATNRFVATCLLEGLGHTVTGVEDGAQAVAAADAAPFDIVLMDMMMPVMGGLEATRLIRTRHTVPILGLTASDSDADRNACMAAGMNGFVTKPINAARLAQAMAAAMQPSLPASGHHDGEGLDHDRQVCP